ncbi:hypothetical protein SODALDRAFT_362680 [Sodiomyces alkalinus F11]|uniref:Uncharacterized protein n=1 Tax=Sodiomyces alkalinus (strain CBS 110278 / VKM F-3762 / F11) TaxID=1314773 RepID=A0A3N2PMU2_SODAK|nr:hypothetical protein SODALDRAFT_362680 [Sodiomyces alkalinus F11]ROT35837.1 hypothetical protein SODALDRAFT_362680 [Sodiomyces alkalinus F11]
MAGYTCCLTRRSPGSGLAAGLLSTPLYGRPEPPPPPPPFLLPILVTAASRTTCEPTCDKQRQPHSKPKDDKTPALTLLQRVLEQNFLIASSTSLRQSSTCWLALIVSLLLAPAPRTRPSSSSLLADALP